jgi:hypothetical protein
MAQQVAEEFDIKAEPVFLELRLHGTPSGGGHDFASALGVRHGQAEEQANDHPEPEAGDEAHWGALNVMFAPADADGDGGRARLSGVEGEGRDAGGFGGRDGTVGIDESDQFFGGGQSPSSVDGAALAAVFLLTGEGPQQWK